MDIVTVVGIIVASLLGLAAIAFIAYVGFVFGFLWVLTKFFERK